MLLKEERLRTLKIIAKSVLVKLNLNNLKLTQNNIFNTLHDENIIYNENLNSNDIIAIEKMLLNNS